MEFSQENMAKFDNGEITYDELMAITLQEHGVVEEKEEENNPDGEEGKSNDNPDDKEDKNKDKKTGTEEKEKPDYKTDPEYLEYIAYKESKNMPDGVKEFDKKIDTAKSTIASLTDETAESIIRKDLEAKGIATYADNIIDTMVANGELVDKAKAILEKEVVDLTASKDKLISDIAETEKTNKLKKEEERIKAKDELTKGLSTTDIHGIKLTEKEAAKIAEKVFNSTDYFSELFMKKPNYLHNFIVLIEKGFFEKNGMALLDKAVHDMVGEDNNGGNKKRKITSNNYSLNP